MFLTVFWILADPGISTKSDPDPYPECEEKRRVTVGNPAHGGSLIKSHFFFNCGFHHVEIIFSK